MEEFTAYVGKVFDVAPMIIDKRWAKNKFGVRQKSHPKVAATCINFRAGPSYNYHEFDVVTLTSWKLKTLLAPKFMQLEVDRPPTVSESKMLSVLGDHFPDCQALAGN
jgi:hypothetical protein